MAPKPGSLGRIWVGIHPCSSRTKCFSLEAWFYFDAALCIGLGLRLFVFRFNLGLTYLHFAIAALPVITSLFFASLGLYARGTTGRSVACGESTSSSQIMLQHAH